MNCLMSFTPCRRILSEVWTCMRNSENRLSKRWLLRALCIPLLVSLLLLLLTVPLQAETPIRIGVLSFRSLQQTEAAWTPTAHWLERQIPGHRFTVVPLFYPDLGKAVEQGQVEFILTNPEHYVHLRSFYGLAAITTLMPLADGHPVSQFGGVIVTKADRNDINTLHELSGKKVAAPEKFSLGGYLMQYWELHKAGIDLRSELKMMFTGMPHDKVVMQVQQGRVDAGFVRTGVLESMAQEGTISLADFKVLQPRKGFPQLLSTDLYPEWPFSAMPQVPRELVKQVNLALLAIQPDAEAAQAGRYYGFSPPGNYGAVEAIMLRLRLHPDGQDFSLREVIQRYAAWLVAALAFLLLNVAAVLVWTVRTNHRLRLAQHELQQLNSSLEEKVAESLADLRKKDQILIEQSRFSALGEMITNISHHWRQPINNIGVILQSLLFYHQHGELSGELLQHQVDEAMQVVHSLSHTIDEFRHTCVEDTGRCSFAVGPQVRRLLDLIHAPLTSGGIILDTCLDTPCSIVGYPSRFNQVLLHLITNAKDALLRASPPSPHIMVSLHVQGTMVELAVEDTGGGIDEEVLPRIFDPYFTTKHKGQGVGLSLYFARAIVEDTLQGTLTAENTGQGARFMLRFPECSVEQVPEKEHLHNSLNPL